MGFEYKGYFIQQSSYNHHIMIAKDDHMVYHASCTKKMSKRQLKKIVDRYIDFKTDEKAKIVFDAIYEEEEDGKID